MAAEKSKPVAKKFNPWEYGNTVSLLVPEITPDVYAITDKGMSEKPITRAGVYRQLSADFPEDVVERSDGKKTGKGYDTTGIKHQALIDRLNDVLTPWGWHLKINECSFQELKTAGGRTMYDCLVDVEIMILGETKPHSGGHISTTRGDAKKGAITNAVKKCLASFGVGRQSYIGSLDDDNVPLVDDKSKKQAAPAPVTKEEKKVEAKPEAKVNYLVTLEDMQGKCWVGKQSKDKQWSALPDTALTSISNFQSDPKAATIAKAVLEFRKFNAILAKTMDGYEDKVLASKHLEEITKNLNVTNWETATEGQRRVLIDELTTRNNGMRV